MTEPVTRSKNRTQAEAIRHLIHQRLQARTLVETSEIPFDAHLDEDTLGAFVEGRLGEVDSSSIIAHLVACGSCRQTTTQLIRLESAVDVETDSTITNESPGRLRLLLEELAARMIPTLEDDAVFAYQNPPDQTEVSAEQGLDEPTQTETPTENPSVGETPPD
jgi:hypothetical protein